MDKVNVGVIGSTGYTGIELIKILNKHPKTEIVFLGAKSQYGKNLSSIVPSLLSKKDIKIKQNSEIYKIKKIDVIFSCLPHGELDIILKRIKKLKAKIIDLSADFRLPKKYNDIWYGRRKNENEYNNFQYLLPELNGNEFNRKKNISNPGCYATSVLLGLAPILPILQNNESIIVDSKSGISGAGKSRKLEHIFSEANENLSIYNPGVHRHIPEIENMLYKTSKKKIKILMVPHLLPVTRGIMSNIYIRVEKPLSKAKIIKLFDNFYAKSHFVKILKDSLPSLRDVQFTNFCSIGIHIFNDKKTILISSVIDNLVKGASGQAMQNMNIMFGFDERLGL
ncbi:MAG TPA: N-acetyl-gamma-glutamyl-phosphate reductase [Candidatus Dadabacteria bacterium]|nr:N-acetyl-gamma-glutamyl-phosphate reductase [Candidatus Dadabacteria bacterium]